MLKYKTNKPSPPHIASDHGVSSQRRNPKMGITSTTICRFTAVRQGRTTALLVSSVTLELRSPSPPLLLPSWAMLSPHTSAPLQIRLPQVLLSHLHSQQRPRKAKRTIHLKQAWPKYSAADDSLAENAPSLELPRTWSLSH